MKGVPLDGAKISNVLNARDGDLISVGDTAVLIEPELEVLSERDGDDSAAVEIPGKNLVDDINKSIGTELNAREPQDLTKVVDGLTSSLGLGVVDELLDGLFGKRELSSAEILANAWKALIETTRDTRTKQPKRPTRTRLQPCKLFENRAIERM